MTFHRLPLKSETFKKSQMSEPFDVPSGCDYLRHVNSLVIVFGSPKTKRMIMWIKNERHCNTIVHWWLTELPYYFEVDLLPKVSGIFTIQYANIVL